MAALQPSNFFIMDTVFDPTDRTVNVTCNFTRPVSVNTPCTYYFDVITVDSPEIIKIYEVSPNDILRSSFLIPKLSLETAFEVRGRSHCDTMDPPWTSSNYLGTFSTPTCLEASNFNLDVCPPPPPTNLQANLYPSWKPDGNVTMSVSWSPPNIPSNASGTVYGPCDFNYVVQWTNEDAYPLNDIAPRFITRVASQLPPTKSTFVLVSDLLPGYNYTVKVSAAIARNGVGRGEKARTTVPSLEPFLPVTSPSTVTIVKPLPGRDSILDTPTAAPAPAPAPTRSISSELNTPVNLVAISLSCAALIILIVIALFLVKRRQRRKRMRTRSSLVGSHLSVVPVLHQINKPGVMLSVDNLNYLPHRQPSLPMCHDYLPVFPNEEYTVDAADIVLLPPMEGSLPTTAVTVLEELGRGAFGVVYRASVTVPGLLNPMEVAVKTVRGQVSSAEECNALLSEIEIMKSISSHPSVIRMIGYCISPACTCLLLEFCAKSDLQSYLRSFLAPKTHQTNQGNHTLQVHQTNQAEIARTLLGFAVQIADGMEHLSRNNVVHRDLAARNILVTEDECVKITDFGMSRTVPLYYRRTTNGKVPWKWLAPESLRDNRYSTKSDVWSFGLLLYEIFSLGCSPWPNLDDPVQLQVKMDTKVHMAKPTGCSQEVYEVMKACWEMEPEKRPSFSELSSRLRRIVPSHDSSYVYFRHSPLRSAITYSNDSAMDSGNSGTSSMEDETVIEIN